MSNALYDKGREKFLSGALDWSSHNIIAILCTSGYTPNLATHEFITDLGANIVARSGNLASKTVTAGVADAADKTLTAVTGSTVTQIILARDTGTDATSPLIAKIDSATNLPITPNGGDLAITWDNGANKIFKL
jgi:hypothetical protein